MELIEKDGWIQTLKPRHVIVCEKYEQALMEAIAGYTGDDGEFVPGVPSRERRTVKSRRCLGIGSNPRPLAQSAEEWNTVSRECATHGPCNIC